MTLQDLKISFIPGLLSIQDAKGEETIIPEATMENYRKFYTSYLLAVETTVGTGEGFLESWCFNQRFRRLIIEALVSLGVDNPERFTPSQLEALLMGHEGKAGLLFQLHNTFPKLRKLETKDPPKLNPLTSIFSKLRKFFVLQMGTLSYPL